MKKIAIIDYFPKDDRDYFLGNCLQQLGYFLQKINFEDISINNSNQIEVGKNLLEADILIWRYSESEANSTEHILKAAETSGMLTLNSSQSIALCSNKWKTHIALLEANIASAPSELLIPGYCFTAKSDSILKPLNEAEGKRIKFLSKGKRVKTDELSILQEYFGVSENFGRITVFDQKIMGAYKRISTDNVSNNLALGATPMQWDVPQEALELALKASEATSIVWSGVDVVFWQNKWWIIEINSSPGYNGHLILEGELFVEKLAQKIDNYIQSYQD